MISNPSEPLWVERYRPTQIADCILPKAIKKQFEDIAKTKQMPNMILSGGPGTGKTTIAKALCNELGVDWIVINASEDNGVDILRTKVREFASTVSFSDAGKCVIMDEADHLTPNAQAAFRGSIESFSKTCSFIFTCNYPNRLIEPLFSRCVHIPFDIPKAESAKLQAGFFTRVCDILKHENIPFDQKVVATLVTKFFPDNRRILGQLQQYARSGSIDEGVLMDLQSISIDTLVNALKQKNFKDIRQWCAENSGNDLTNIYSKLYNKLKDIVTPNSIPDAILILEDYQRYDSIVPDKELHVSALCVAMLIELEFK